MSRPTVGTPRIMNRCALLMLCSFATSCDEPPTAQLAERESITVEPSTATLGQTERLQLTVIVLSATGDPVLDAQVRFSSSNPVIASVTRQGVLTAHQAGTALIRVQANGRYAFVPVTVQKVVNQLEIYVNPQMRVGESQLLGVEAWDLQGFGMSTDVRVTSGDEGVASVRRAAFDLDYWPHTHEVLGVADGQVTITARAGNLTASATLTVVP